MREDSCRARPGNTKLHEGNLAPSSSNTAFVTFSLGARIVDDCPEDVEWLKLAAHCLMQNASSASRPLVLIDDRRPISVDRVALKRTLAGYSGDNLMSAFA